LEEFEINLVFQLLSRMKAPPVMVDVGAHLGMSLWRFASTGYQVHAFEPNPEIRAGLENNTNLQKESSMSPFPVPD
jgi:FkbM family methyltransferase